jgi:DNA-binding NtrC family response regulator
MKTAMTKLAEPPYVSRVMEQMPHILVVDDDREIRDLLARFLEEKHHMRVTAVRDAKEARRCAPSPTFRSSC